MPRAARAEAVPERVPARDGWLKACLAAAGLGAVAAFGQAPWGLWWLALPAYAAILALALRARGWRAFGVGWFAGAGHFAVALQWLVEPFLVEPEIHGWMAPFALAFMAGGLALFWGAGTWLARRIAPSGWPAAPALAACLGLAEAGRALLFTGFPWAMPGHVWIGTPLAQAAAWAGPHGLTALTLGLAVAAARWWRSAWLAAPVALVAALWVALDPGPAAETGTEGPLIRLVQPNAPQDLKWAPGHARMFFERALSLSAEGPPPDLVVWPETSVPWLLEQADGPLEDAAASGGGAPVILGLIRREGSRYYNSLAVVGAEGRARDIYDKHHLVPFGEYIPLGELAARFGLRGLAAGDGGGYASGPGPALVEVPGIGPVLPLICYEGIFAEEVGAAPARPRAIALITNDAWFGTGSGPQQHFAQARLRAIEQGVPMIRVANTGISGMIDARGRVTAELGLGQAGAIDAVLPPALPPTPYARTGDAPILVALALLALGAVVSGRRFSVDGTSGRG